MAQETKKRKTWLRRAAFITGVIGLTEIIVWGLFRFEGGPSWYALPSLSIYITPFLVGLFISWKSSLIGGITLIVIAIVWLLFITMTYFLTPAINPISELLWYAVTIFAALGLPYLVPGILFVLAAKHNV